MTRTREMAARNGAPTVRQRLETGRGCPDGLRALLEAGAPVLIQARVSNSAGRASYQAAVQNLVTAAHKLATSQVFPSLPDLLPPTQRLADQLRDDSEVQRSEDVDGAPFENRFLTLTLPACDQVHIHLSCGSGRKVDMDSLHQPVARHSAAYIRHVKPALVCAAEVARWARGGWPLAPWSIAVQTLEEHWGEPAYLSFDGDRPKPYSQTVETELFLRANNAAHESHDMRARTTSAIRGRLPVPDEGGFAAYPLPYPPPPPLAVAWRLVPGAGSQPQQVVFIDTPSVRGELAPSIAYGMPAVLDANGRPVDQLKLVRFVLAHRGKPGWTPTRLAHYLATHQFSSEGIRRQSKSLSTSVRVRPGNKNDIWHVIKSIENNLEFYRTGELRRGIGDRSGPHLITTLLPPDGLPYLSDEDYDLIRTLVEENQVARTRHHRYTFGHIKVTYENGPAHLVAHCEDGQVVYRIRRDPLPSPLGSTEGIVKAGPESGLESGLGLGLGRGQPSEHLYGRSVRKAPADGHRGRRSDRVQRPAPVIPADLLALSLVEGLIAGHADLTPFVAAPEPRIDEAHEKLALARAALKKKEHRRDQLYADLYPDDGGPGPTGPLRAAVTDEYNDLHSEILDLQHQLEQANLVAERHARATDPRSIAVEELLTVVASLRDPYDIRFHEQWRHAICDLRIWVASRREHGVMRHDTGWTGSLLIHQGTDQHAIAFLGTSARPSGGRQHGVEEAVAALRSGVGLRDSTWGNLERRDQLRQALGVPPGAPMPALNIRDPRLLRIAMAIVYPPRQGPPSHTRQVDPVPTLVGPPLSPRQLPAAARRLNEPLSLLKRIQATNPPDAYATGSTRRWISKGDRDVNQACRLAAANGGTLRAADFEADDWNLLRHAAKRCDKRLFTFQYGRMSLQPCPRCYSLHWLHLDIREATEPVCGDCRHDFTGIEWPADPYDQYAYGHHD